MTQNLLNSYEIKPAPTSRASCATCKGAIAINEMKVEYRFHSSYGRIGIRSLDLKYTIKELKIAINSIVPAYKKSL